MELPVYHRKQLVAYAVVDDDVYEWAQHFRWFLHHGYAERTVLPRRHVFLHREVLGAQRGQSVDHINGDRLDNRRANLRFANDSQNQQNRQSAQRNSKTGVRGVRWRPDRQLYRAEVVVKKRQLTIGHFATLEEADAAVKDARRRMMTHSSEAGNAHILRRRSVSRQTKRERKTAHMKWHLFISSQQFPEGLRWRVYRRAYALWREVAALTTERPDWTLTVIEDVD